MLRAKPKTLLLMTAVACCVIAGAALAGGNSKLPAKAEAFAPFAGHRVSGPTAAVDSARRAKGPRAIFIESNAREIEIDGRSDGFMRCPKRMKAINGYFGSEGGVVLDYSARGTQARRWEFGLLNISGEERQFFVGTVCMRGV